MNHEEFKNQVFHAYELQDLKGKRVLVALSGGADSVALLRLLLAASIDCHAAHCNFHLRGDESMRDERFVRDLCLKLDVPLSVKDFDVAAWQRENGGSLEMACRELRYAWFKQLREQLGCDLIAVAHHADDQVETFFLNLMRGTGLRGLTGMKRMTEDIWRPLLEVTRDDIIDYLDTIGQDYVTDSTNAQNDYRRNRIRNTILPIIEQHFPNARARILDTMQNLTDDNEMLECLVKDHIDDYQSINIQDLCNHPHAATLLYHRIRHLGFNRHQCIQVVGAMQTGHVGRQFAGKGYILYVNRQSLDIVPASASDNNATPIDLTSSITSPVRVDITRGHMPFSPLMCDGKNKVAFNTQLLECKHIVLRHWRQGDRIAPFGMRGTKLVSDLFNDYKLDSQDKHNVWLLEADGDILWVLGYRASSHYPIKPESQDFIILHFQN